MARGAAPRSDHLNEALARNAQEYVAADRQVRQARHLNEA